MGKVDINKKQKKKRFAADGLLICFAIRALQRRLSLISFQMPALQRELFYLYFKDKI